MSSPVSYRPRITGALALAASTALLLACGDSNAPRTQSVSISMTTLGASTSASASAPALASSAQSATSPLAAPITGGGHTLSLTTMELTIDDLRLQREGTESEDDHGGIGSGDIAFNAGSQTVALPVNGGVVTLATKSLPAGTFTEVEAELRSLHLVGSYDGAAFDVNVELSHDMKAELNPPLTTNGGTDQNLTVAIDFTACFANAGVPVDPRTLADGGSAARAAFRDCVASHLRAFDDDNRDGHE
jgi:hypothetical protein